MKKKPITEVKNIGGRYYPTRDGVSLTRPSKVDPSFFGIISFGTREAADQFLLDLDKSDEEG